MRATTVPVQRISLVSVESFDEVLARLTAAIGHPDMEGFHRAVATTATMAALEEVVQRAMGSSGLMEFARYDAGAVLRKEPGGRGVEIIRLVLGNPIIMKEMARTVHDAAAYAPITILIDKREDGVHLSYDTMESLIAPYGSESALVVARDLDAKVERLLESAAH